MFVLFMIFYWMESLISDLGLRDLEDECVAVFIFSVWLLGKERNRKEIKLWVTCYLLILCFQGRFLGIPNSALDSAFLFSSCLSLVMLLHWFLGLALLNL
jgi:hypothetical protein